MIYEAMVTTRDGEREYSKHWYCVAETLEDAVNYFNDKVCEEAGDLGWFQEEGPHRKGYWDESGETFTYLNYTGECRGLVIPNTKGNAQFIDFGAENWRKKYYDYQKEMVKNTEELGE